MSASPPRADNHGKRNVKYAYAQDDDGSVTVATAHDTMHLIDSGTFSHKKSFIKARVADTFEHRFTDGVLDSVRHTSILEVNAECVECLSLSLAWWVLNRVARAATIDATTRAARSIRTKRAW